MKLTKNKENEVLNVYDTWLHSYLNGDVATYHKFLDDAYHFIGSTNNEEFLNRNETTTFFEATADQLAGKCQLKEEKKIVETFGDLVFITHVFDAWFLNGSEWTYYSRFRFSSVLQEKKAGWRFIYQHFSTTDNKADTGETIGFDKVHLENQELREAIKRRTVELEAKNRELEIEGALARIRAQAVAMQQSTDLLDIVVTMRTEFTKLGHEAHYFWHMMWLPETYEKAMTSGDGSKIGFVMTLPRHMHGDIPLLADWEQSDEATVIYPMNTKAAIGYVDKMVNLGDFKNIDPQAPTHDDIRHIGGLTFIMARTTHGEIGYSLPGVVKNPPAADLDILLQFAGAFDLAHRRFLDLQKAEKQAREVQIELALEKVRSRTMAMQHSDELQEASFLLDQQVRALGIRTRGCAFNIYGQNDATEWFSSEEGTMPVYRTPRENVFLEYYEAGKLGESLYIKEFEGDACAAHYDYLCTLPVMGEALRELKANGGSFPEKQIDHATFFKYGYLLFITLDVVPEAHDIFKRFAKVFEQTYTRFLDLQKAEAQAREAQIETALERVRSRTMAMQNSEELEEVILEVLKKLQGLRISMDQRAAAIFTYEAGNKEYTQWVASPEYNSILSFNTPYFDHPVQNDIWNARQNRTDFYAKPYPVEVKNSLFKYLFDLPALKNMPQSEKTKALNFKHYSISIAFQKQAALVVVDHSGIPLTEAENSILIRLSKVFNQTYTRFLDLQKAEAQAREAQIEMALEKVRSRTMAMQNSNELPEAANNLFLQVQELGIPAWSAGYCIWEEDQKSATAFMSSEGVIQKPFVLPSIGVGYDFSEPLKKGEVFHVEELGGKLIHEHYEFMRTLPIFGEVIDGILEAGHPLPTFQIFHICYFEHGYVMFITYETVPKAHGIFKRFAKVFEQTYTRFLDLKKAEAQAREAQIEAALERTRTQSMLMQRSDELSTTTQVFHEQLRLLGIDSEFSYLWLPDEDEKNHLFWATWDEQKKRKTVYRNKAVTFPLDKNEPAIKACYAAWESEETVHVNEVKSNEVKEYFNTWSELLNGVSKFQPELFPDGLFYIDAYMDYGCFGIMIKRELDDDEKNILGRFSKEFQRTYTRFLDLQKAEVQAREKEIELALEQVRSRTMAMHNPEELQEVVAVVAKKLKELGVIFDAGGVILCTYFPDNKDVIHWISVDDFSSSGRYFVPYFDNPIFNDAWDSKMKGDAYFSKAFPVAAKNDFFKHAFANSDYRQMPEDYKQFVLQADSHNLSAAWSKNSAIIIPSLNGTVPSESDADILTRFAKVFEQAYIRFLDLQKAEAQAREVQIEMALEKVRSRTMAMQKGEELQDVVVLLYKELIALGVTNFATCGYVEINEETNRQATWVTSPGGDSLGLFHLPLTGDVHFDARYAAWKNKQTVFHQTVAGTERRKHLEYAITTFNSKEAEEMVRNQFPDPTVFYCFNFSHGYLHLVSGSLLTKEEENLLARFTKVFEQTYARFLDLKKAEAQAREAQIEAALEKVRSRSLAMQKSDELLDVIGIVSEQLHVLRLKFDTICFGESNKDGAVKFWLTSKGLPKPILVDVPPIKNKGVQRVVKAQKDGLKFLADVVTGKTYTEWNNHMLINSQLQYLPEAAKTYLAGTSGFARSSFFLKEIALYAMNYQIEPFSDTDNAIFNRFAQVFDQSYTRFLDLQKAEAQAREAQIEAALERVRSRSLEMSESSEMQNVANEILEQVRAVGLKIDALAMSGVIDNDSDYDVWVGGANSKKPLRIPYNNETQVQREFNKAIKERPEFFTKTYTGKVMKDYFKVLKGTGNSFNPEIVAFMKTCTGFTTTLTFMKNSGIQLIRYSEEAFSKEDNAVIVRFGRVFEQAYIRFLDLQKAEEQTLLAQQNLIRLQTQKQRAEEALSELQQTQTQLIQSEKMASLGELTAGIAHEIQNPLNFVNNFSEVSKELLEEMQEEIENGDLEEVKAIMDDITQNLEKINHHGKRADGIVKGMLQHSRSSSGKKEPTDINALADEYLRLAYHGLRAKDKSFNAELVTDFDETIGEIDVIPQDIGRVMLNLITNAFYAVNEKKSIAGKGFKPTVSVKTKKEKEVIRIAVTDNGKGIPKDIVDKIFQPFFTTKPTGEGTGLGLSMSYDIVTKGHGGELKVETNQGVGTTFIIYLPIQNKVHDDAIKKSQK